MRGWTRAARTASTLTLLALLGAACAAETDEAGAGDESSEAGAEDTGEEDAGEAEEAPSEEEATPEASEETAEASESTAEGEPILIGVNIEQSGGASVQGQAYADAVTLLADQLNADGGIDGRPVELLIEDNSTDQTEAVTVTRRLTDEGIVAMIGPGTSPTTLAAMDVILETGVPTFSMGSADAIVTPVEERPNVFKTPQNASLAAEEIVTRLADDGIASAGLIAVNNPYGDAGIDAMQAAVDAGDVELVGVERFEGDDPDTTAQLNNLVSAGAEAIVVWAIPPGAPTVRRNAVENLGLDLPMYFDAGAGAELFIELAGQAADGALMIHPKSLVWDEVAEDDPQFDVLQEFGQGYTEEYGEISGFAGYAWDALGLIKASIEQAGSTDPAEMAAALEGLGEYVGVTGTYEITAEDHQGLGDGDLVLLTVEDGEWSLVEE